MSPDQYLVPAWDHANICFSCRRACGGCSWSEIDPETDKPRFQPVPGWKAKPSRHYLGRSPDGQKKFIDTWHITACPMFIPDRGYKPLNRPPQKKPGHGAKPVEKVDASGKVVAEYPSVAAAARENRVNEKTVRNRCSGEIKTPLGPYGYNFRFKEGNKA